ncbi:MAG TPA: O-antigen ligase family protein, partial [Acidimicrobiales bacterium]|nr:O-antigen ligase family protein [Acidimicrobiales bacterium]
GFYWMIALGIAIELLVRGKGKAWIWMAVPALGAAVLLTQSRAALLGAAITVLFGLRSQIGRSITRRVRLTALLGLALVVFLPLVAFSGLGHRFVSPGGTTNSGHKNRVSEGISIMFHNPVGRGLATGAGGGQVAQTQGAVSQGSVFIPEDEWLQIGTQLGFLGLGIYVAGLILMVRYLRIPRAGPGDPRQPGEVRGSGWEAGLWASGVRSGLLGVMAGGLFLQPFVEPVVSWTVFALTGLAVGLSDAEVAEIHDNVTTTLSGRAVESVTAQ